MGHLAVQDEETFQFLVKASRPEFWANQEPWIKADPEGGAVRPMVLAGASLKGLALTGRREAADWLNWIKNHPQ